MDDQERYEIAALAGATLYALRFFQGTWQRRAVLLFSGWCFANWIGPVVIEVLHVQTQAGVLGCGLVCGFLGDKSLGVLNTAAEQFLPEILTALLKKK